MSDETQRVIAGNFELTVVLTDKRQLRMTGYVYSDDDASAINKRVDSFQDVLDRQCIRVDLTTKDAEIAQADANLEALAAHNEMLLAKKDTGSLTSQEKQQLKQYDSSVRFLKKQKESLAAAKAEGRKKLNGAA